MTIKNVLFDLDGTLTDPAEGITKSCAYALEKFGIHTDNLNDLNKFIGPPLIDSFIEFYGFSHDNALLGLQYYREYFSTQGIFQNKKYPGIDDLLASLKDCGKKLYVATSKPEQFTFQILEHFKLIDYFSFVGGNTMTETRHFKEDVIRYVIDSNPDIDISETVMVGDRLHDIIGAHKNGIPCIGVLYGYGSNEELTSHNADCIVMNIPQLKNVLLNNLL